MSDKPTYRWNEEGREVAFWDPSPFGGREVKKIVPSDLRLIRAPAGARHEEVLRALCRVVSELVEIEERRNRDSEPSGTTPPPDQL